jgi:glucose/arabinose dehydrogenase
MRKKTALAIALLGAGFVLSPIPCRAGVTLQPVASSLSSPVGIVNAGDGSGRLFFVEQTGRIRVWDGTSVLAPAFLDVHTLVSTGSERGLLGLAFHPAYRNNGRFFIFYTALDGDLTIVEYHATPDANVADPGQVQLIRSINHPSSNHNGGMLAFGPDGYLYASTGDGGGSAGDPEGDAQSLGTLLGKILRFDVDAPPPFIPPSNPFVDGNPATRDEIWAFGLRNPWRFTFDRLNGDLYIGDVGENCFEEIDRQPAASSGGTNYGWNVVEGNTCFDGDSCSPSGGCGQSNYQAPIVVTGHDPECAITGGYRYRGSGSPELAGMYIFGDYCSGVIRAATQATGGTWSKSTLLDTDLGISTFGEDDQGELYVADVFGGKVYRITGSGPPQQPVGDDFEDGEASDWAVDSGSWSVVGGALTNAPAEQARILAPFTACATCTITARFAPPAPGTDIILIGWWKNAGTRVELIVSESRNKVILQRYVKGEVVEKMVSVADIDTVRDLTLTILISGKRFNGIVRAGGEDIVNFLWLHALNLKPGRVGFAVKGKPRGPASGAMMEIEVE